MLQPRVHGLVEASNGYLNVSTPGSCITQRWGFVLRVLIEQYLALLESNYDDSYSATVPDAANVLTSRIRWMYPMTFYTGDSILPPEDLFSRSFSVLQRCKMMYSLQIDTTRQLGDCVCPKAKGMRQRGRTNEPLSASARLAFAPDLFFHVCFSFDHSFTVLLACFHNRSYTALIFNWTSCLAWLPSVGNGYLTTEWFMYLIKKIPFLASQGV